MANLAISKEFLSRFGRLERAVQTKVADVFEKFGEATHTGIHLERIANARDNRLRSIRIDQFWRGIVLAPATGDTYLLLTVLPHDDAYTWAQRRTVTINTASGVIEVRDAQAIEETLPELREQAGGTEHRLLSAVKDAQLRALGIDDQVLEFARQLTDLDQLESAKETLPQAQYDALLGLALGMSVEDVWSETAGYSVPSAPRYDPDDIEAAAERSGDRLVLVNGPEELMDAFSYPFDMWRVFLHPSQRRAAYGSFSGPARVTGGPGTGKTVVAVHRARHLATRSPQEHSVLLTTFTKTLARSMEDSLRLLVDDDDLLRRIDVRNLDQVANRIVSGEHGPLNLLKQPEERSWWEWLAGQQGSTMSQSFLAQEWRQVVLGQGIETKEAYLAAERTGRGRPLGPRQREEAWAVLTAFAQQLVAMRRWTHETICVEATRIVREKDVTPYRHVVVDEAQDLAPWQWRLIRALVAQGPDDIFVAGDPHQRIYDHRVTLRRLGIAVAGRSARLTINYRTTAEILGWSFGILTGESFDDLDGGLETLSGCRSDMHGTHPRLFDEQDQDAELGRLVETVREWLAQGVSAGEIGVTARTVRIVNAAIRSLRDARIPAWALADGESNADAVCVGTMHRLKGLEFRCVAVIGASAANLPAPGAVTPAADDPIAHELDVQRERCLLFVACTRAREELAVSWHGERSALMPSFAVLRTPTKRGSQAS